MNGEYIKLVEQTLEINHSQQRLISHQLKNNENDSELLNEGWFGDIAHGALDVVGLVPILGEPFDLINGVYYTVEGDYVNAGLSFVALNPFGGDEIKVAGRLAMIANKARKISKLGKLGTKGEKVITKIIKAEVPTILKKTSTSSIKKTIGKSIKETGKKISLKALTKTSKLASKGAKIGTAVRGAGNITMGTSKKVLTDTLNKAKAQLKNGIKYIEKNGIKMAVIGGSIILLSTLLWYIKPIISKIYDAFKSAIKYASYLSSELVTLIKEMYKKFKDWFNSNKKYAVDPKEILALKV